MAEVQLPSSSTPSGLVLGSFVVTPDPVAPAQDTNAAGTNFLWPITVTLDPEFTHAAADEVVLASALGVTLELDVIINQFHVPPGASNRAPSILLLKNGTSVARSSTGYISNSGGQNTSSNHIHFIDEAPVIADIWAVFVFASGAAGTTDNLPVVTRFSGRLFS